MNRVKCFGEPDAGRRIVETRLLEVMAQKDRR